MPAWDRAELSQTGCTPLVTHLEVFDQGLVLFNDAVRTIVLFSSIDFDALQEIEHKQ